MRTTRETLLRLARDTAAISANQDRSIVCIYLTGSLVTDDPFIGGSTDVDLFYVHSEKPAISREIRYLSDDATLDIAHVEQSLYQQPRSLRGDAWLGPFLCAKPKVLYDTRHWFEFTEASVGAQFYRPEYMLERARPQSAEARRIWMDYHLAPPEVSPARVLEYLKSIQLSGNAVALLNGAPMPLRRFYLDLPVRARVIKRPEIYEEFESLILPEDRGVLDWDQWIPLWQNTLKEVSKLDDCPVQLTKPRFNYYTKAVDSLWEEHPAAAAWIMLNSWTRAIALMESEILFYKSWMSACSTFLNIETSFNTALDRADHLLDSVEEILDDFSSSNGLVEYTP